MRNIYTKTRYIEKLVIRHSCTHNKFIYLVANGSKFERQKRFTFLPLNMASFSLDLFLHLLPPENLSHAGVLALGVPLNGHCCEWHYIN